MLFRSEPRGNRKGNLVHARAASGASGIVHCGGLAAHKDLHGNAQVARKRTACFIPRDSAQSGAQLWELV